MKENELEAIYQNFTQNFEKLAPDGILHIDLESLCEMELINEENLDLEDPDELTQYFHVAETSEKIILHNEKFAIWIVPKIIDDISTTHTYISRIEGKTHQLELIYATEGIYNSPKFILKILQHLLTDMLDTDEVLRSIDAKKDS